MPERSSEIKSDIRYSLLGPIAAIKGNTEIALGSAKQRSVLAVLLLKANTAGSREAIIDAVWGDSPPASGPNLVAVYVAGLRKALGASAGVTRPGAAEAEELKAVLEGGQPG